MKFMATWKLPPGNQAVTAERFLSAGAPMPDGLTMLGRWHAPGSTSGFLLVEADDLTPLATHMAEWGGLLELQVTPVLEDTEAGEAMAKGTG